MTPADSARKLLAQTLLSRINQPNITNDARRELIAQAITDARNEALEEAAKECDRMADATPGHTNVFAHNLAISIRALKRKERA